MIRKPGLLAKIDAGRVSNWIASLGGPPPQDTIDEILDPGKKQVARLTDDELAAVVAREPGSKLGHLAASEIRHRESWSSPARWAMLISLASLVLAFAAFLRTL